MSLKNSTQVSAILFWGDCVACLAIRLFKILFYFILFLCFFNQVKEWKAHLGPINSLFPCLSSAVTACVHGKLHRKQNVQENCKFVQPCPDRHTAHWFTVRLLYLNTVAFKMYFENEDLWYCLFVHMWLSSCLPLFWISVWLMCPKFRLTVHM